MMADNYYVILGIDEGAGLRQIETAYRARVRDVEAGHDVGWPLAMIQEAFAILSDPFRRQPYDRALHKVPAKIESPVGARAAEPLIPENGPRGIGDVSLTRSFRTFRPSFEEIYERLWSNFRRAGLPKSEQVKSLTIEIPITAEQAMTGGSARVLVPALVECPVCHGQGGVMHVPCVRCEGRGAIADQYPVLVSYPPGRSGYTAQVALDRLGIHNFYLTVHFRLTHDPIE